MKYFFHKAVSLCLALSVIVAVNLFLSNGVNAFATQANAALNLVQNGEKSYIITNTESLRPGWQFDTEFPQAIQRGVNFSLNTGVTQQRIGNRVHFRPAPVNNPNLPNLVRFVGISETSSNLPPGVIGTLVGVDNIAIDSLSVAGAVSPSVTNLNLATCQVILDLSAQQLKLIPNCANAFGGGFSLLSNQTLGFSPGNDYSIDSTVTNSGGFLYRISFSSPNIASAPAANPGSRAFLLIANVSGLTPTTSVDFVDGSGAVGLTDANMRVSGTVPPLPTAAPIIINNNNQGGAAQNLSLISAFVGTDNITNILQTVTATPLHYRSDTRNARVGERTTVQLEVDGDPNISCISGQGIVVTMAPTDRQFFDNNGRNKLVQGFTIPSAANINADVTLICNATRVNSSSGVSETIQVDFRFQTIPASGSAAAPTTIPTTTTTAAAGTGQLRSAAPTANCSFTDLNTTFSHIQEAILHLCQIGLVAGNPDGTVRPNDRINRAEMAKLLTLGFFANEVLTSVGIKPFPDVPTNVWYAAFVEAAKRLRIFDGYTDGTFRGANNLTMAEMAKVLVNGSGIDALTNIYNRIKRLNPQLDWFESFYKAIEEYTGVSFPRIPDWGVPATRGEVFYRLYLVITQ